MDGFDETEYITNQNILSDIENIVISTNPNNPTLMSYDGVLNFNATTGSNDTTTLYINGKPISVKGTPWDGAGLHDITVCFNKGDSIYESGSVNVQYVRYYKLRDYSNR